MLARVPGERAPYPAASTIPKAVRGGVTGPEDCAAATAAETKNARVPKSREFTSFLFLENQFHLTPHTGACAMGQSGIQFFLR
jgi:hypothetical protein